MAAPRTRNWRSALLCGTALVPILGGVALAQSAPGAVAQIAPDARPQGGQVVAGSASIAQNPALTSVQQSSERAVVDWRSFNIGRDHTVQFQQPSAASITLNRVTAPDPSVIAGRMTANGQIALVNQSGVLVTQGAQIQAQSVIISTADISNQAFMAGGPRLTFDRPGQPGARIENQGSISVREAGLAALVAPQVANRGTISARMGRVMLGGADTHTIDLHGDGLLSLELTSPVRQAPANGDALVSNTGLIDAPGGTVLLTAQAADGIVQDLVRAGGRIAADGTGGAAAGRVLVRGTGGSVRIEGEVTANAPEPGGTGGSVSAQADRVAVTGTARIEASGRAGGGRVALGTDRRGRVAPGMARRTTIAPGATIRADATERGAGGEVLVNSTEVTAHAGAISARGGPQGGDGGFVEVSGQRRLAITGGIDVSAPQGAAGSILLDPVFLSIVADDDPRVNIDPSLLNDGVLSGGEGNDSFLATGVVGSFAGNLRLEATADLTVEVALTKALGGLALVAGRNLTINAPLILQDPDPALVLLLSGAQIAINALTQVPASGRINLQTPSFVGNNIVQAGAGRFVGGVLDSGADSIPGSFNLMDLQGDNAIGSLGDQFASTLLFRNTAPLTIPSGATVQASTLRIDVDGGDLAVDGAVIAANGPFAATLRASGDISVTEGGRVEGDGLRLIAGFDFASGAPDAAAAAALRLSGTIQGFFSDGGLNDVELTAGAGGILLSGAQIRGLNLDLTAGAGGIAQTGGRIFIGQQLRVTTPGDAALAVTPAAALDGNRIGALGPSNVTGDFSLTALGAEGGVSLSGDIRVGGSFTLRSRAGGISQAEGSRLLVGSLDATTPAGIRLDGDNEIAVVQQLVGGGFNDVVRLRNVTSLEVAGAMVAEDAFATIDVEGGDLLVSGIVSGGSGVALRASGNTTLAAGSLVRADGGAAVELLAGLNPATEATDLPGGLRLAGTLGDAAGLNTLALGAGTGGIQQTGGRLVGQGLSLVSGGDAILDRGGDQAGLRNAITGSLGSLTIPGDFVLDNGATPILLAGSIIAAANIGLRTDAALSLAEPSCFPACASAPAGLDAGAGRISLRAGDLAVVPGGFIRGGLVEVAPAVPGDMAVLFPAPESGSLNLTPDGFAAIQATTLRLGAATFRGVTETTAAGLRFGGPLALDGTLDLRSLGGVTQLAGADLDVARLTGTVIGQVTLTNDGNQFGVVGDFTAGAGLALGTGGALLLDGLVQTDGTAALAASDGIEASGAGRVRAARLDLDSGGPITLSGANTVAALGSVVTGGNIDFRNSGDLLLDGLVQASGFSMALNVVGALTQSPGAGLLVTSFGGSATGGATLGGANQLAFLNGFSAGAFDFVLNNATPLLTLPAASGVVADGAVVVTQAGLLAVDGTITAAGITLQASDINLAGVLQANNAVTLTAFDIQATGTGRISAPLLSLNAEGVVALEGANEVAVLGASSLGGGLSFRNAGNLLLAGSLDAAGQDVALDVTGTLTQSPGAGTGITAAALSGRATAGATLGGANQLARIEGFDAGTGDFVLANTAPLLALPPGRILQAGGTLAITQAGDLLIDGTATGAVTTLDATGLLTVNGFSAIARGGDLLLRGDNVAVAGLISALGEIGVEAANTASLGGTATGSLLRVAAPSVSFATLDASGTRVLLQLGGGGAATGALDALALEVSGGSGALLTGTIASIAGGPAAAEGRRSSASGTLLPDPPEPTAFLFNGCPIGVPLCGAVPPVPPSEGPGEPEVPVLPEVPVGPDLPPGIPSVTPVPPAPPAAGIVTLPEGAVTAVNNPAPLIEGLDPAALAAMMAQTRPSAPNVTSSFARDRGEAEDLAPPNIRGGDF
ncbi:filamentous hemagglutinin N-terminal domain-containing protein [Falsiroseomonas sp.]|uniref:two-partner secretion domain-containing protein n=1 Tax=Falsiroseomonas sp. TaxID=2870721 RepID=UPI0027359ED0|nr:filamentous hemagglutinin N-terminal domain-containing protein [Falsiroseomonas sp.]MDP3418225.1 filamentous hemagglutinin N-terminal domain-containing protein [Falsiroseomonas sp.]